MQLTWRKSTNFHSKHDNLDLQFALSTMCQSSTHVSQFAVRVVPQSGHFAHQERPQQVNEHILEFVKGQSSHHLSLGLLVTFSRSSSTSWPSRLFSALLERDTLLSHT